MVHRSFVVFCCLLSLCVFGVLGKDVPAQVDYDVVVVGGGLSGLTSAFRLQNAGLKVVLLEATDELGGRTRSKVYHGNSVSIGGTWAILENTATLQLASEVNAYPFVPLVVPREAKLARLAVFPYLFVKLWILGKDLAEHNDDFWTSPGASPLDHQSLEDWMGVQLDGHTDKAWVSNTKQAVRDWFWLIENFNGTNLSGLSALTGAAFVYKRLRLFGPEGFYSRGLFRWEGGTGVYVHAIADAIAAKGGKMYTSSPVISILYNDAGVEVTTTLNGAKDATTITAKRVIVAASLTSAAEIDYQPPLPPDYYSLFNAITRSDAAAVQVIMTWSEKWYILGGGNAILPDATTEPECGFYAEVFEVTPHNTSQGILRLLVVDPAPGYDCPLKSIPPGGSIKDNAVDWLSEQYTVFGFPVWKNLIKNKLQYTDVWDWRSQRAHIPAVTYYWPPNGTLVAYGHALRQNVSSRVYWGGSERAKNGMHWMEGAIQRGNEAACEVLKDLGVLSNCSIYHDWIKYRYHQVKPKFEKLPHYESGVNGLLHNACEHISNQGYNCSHHMHFRTERLNAFEQAVKAELDKALADIKSGQDALAPLLAELGKLWGDKGPVVHNNHNATGSVPNESLLHKIKDEL